MKQFLLIIAYFIMYANLAFCQDVPQTLYFDYKEKPVVGSQQCDFYVFHTKAGKFWHRKGYFCNDKTLKFDGYFSDSLGLKKEGNFVKYYPNGYLRDSGRFADGKEEGIHLSWYENGLIRKTFKFNDGVKVDTGWGWYRNGKMSEVYITDKNGDGIESNYDEVGTLLVEGQLSKGKRNGIWRVVDNNKILSQVVKYEMDSAILITNYDESGVETGVGKSVEEYAQFPGGLDGWRMFLEKNLKYPKSAQNHGIEAVVKFCIIIDEKGKLTEINLLGDYPSSLSKEALRVLSKSPDWIPAMQYNRKIKSSIIQSITFALM